MTTARLDLEFQLIADRLQVTRFGMNEFSWLNADVVSSLFAVYITNQRWDVNSLTFRGWEDRSKSGMLHRTAHFVGSGFEVAHHILIDEDNHLIEQWQTVQAVENALSITRMDSFSLNIPQHGYELLSFTSDWGQEFEGERMPLRGDMTLETRKGRSSKGMHPYFALAAGTENILSGAAAWSGNWIFRFEPLGSGGYRLSGGLNEWNFTKMLQKGEAVESAPVMLSFGRDLNAVSQQYARAGRRYWYPQNALSRTLPVEWNHWWSYEDKDINETVFLDNADRAAELGIEVCTLDAGWFGDGLEWYQQRGDWGMVNHERFPHGIRALSDAVHARGMRFGLWCEIEGLGAQAELARLHPDYAALRDGAALGYLCFGSPAVQEWAFHTLSRLIRDYNCDWIKLDFNVDPEAGCNRRDHGHGSGDGLYEHVRGYYRVLERIRQEFPEVVLENCSSGGLRIDLGIMRRTHLTFLSDPDWPVHSLQVFWGATTLLAPDACFHWSFSEWQAGKNPHQTFNPRDPHLQPHQLDYYTRIAMLGALGFSQKLPELPGWVANRLKTHIRVYQQHIRRFVREGDLFRLTDQPRRDGTGDRWCAFQYSLPDQSEHLLFVFRLPGGEAERAIRLVDLTPTRVYRLEGFEGEMFPPMTGQELMENGLKCMNMREEESALLRLI